jgi:hypothetical protein
MRAAVRLALVGILLTGCSSSSANQPSAGYCQGMVQVMSVLRDWPQRSMSDHQATTALTKAYLDLAGAAADDFGGQTQLSVAAFSDDVGRLKQAIESGAGTDSAMEAIRQAIPSLPSCPGSPSP